jgi:hypothetical protein
MYLLAWSSEEESELGGAIERQTEVENPRRKEILKFLLFSEFGLETSFFFR